MVRKIKVDFYTPTPACTQKHLQDPRVREKKQATEKKTGNDPIYIKNKTKTLI